MRKQAEGIRREANKPEASRHDRAGFSLRNLRTFASFKNPVYRLYYAGMAGQWAAMNMQLMTNSLLMYRLTGSTAALGLTALLSGLPMLFVSLFGGVIADRVQKKYILLIGLGGSAMVSLGIALALATGFMSRENPGSWMLLLASSFLQGSIMGFMMPSRQAIVPEIVSEDQVTNAVALNNMGMNSLRLLAPAATGFLIDAFDFEAVFFTMTGLYLVGAAFIAFIPRTSRGPTRPANVMKDMAEGFQYVRRESVLLVILLFILLDVALSQPYMRLLPVFTDDVLKVGARGMGILLSVSGAGAIAGSLTLASLPDRKRGLLLLISGLLLGMALVGFAFSSSWYLSLVLIVFVGLGQTGRMTMGNALLQSYAAQEYRGRVMSIMMMEQGITNIGTFFAGLIGEAVGAPWAVGGFAIVLVLWSALALPLAHRLRKLA